ncbi:MAG: mechanosensitive ion channel [Gammaproteobacteria bacterium]|nr:mechanosensitive ion channel [Gammaproteobacteria bacterium]
MVLVVGIALAIVVRLFILFWGLKIASRNRNGLDEQLLRIGAGVAALLLAYIAIALAVTTLGLSEFAEMVTLRVLASMLVLQLMRVAMRAGQVGLAILGRIRDRFAIVEERTLPLFDLMLTIIIVAAASYALLQVWNIDPTAWLASAGIIGIAVGFAARDTLANLFAGFFIIADAPYKLGDYVVLDTGERGQITKVGIRSTRLLTRDDVEIVVRTGRRWPTPEVVDGIGRALGKVPHSPQGRGCLRLIRRGRCRTAQGHRE